MPVVASPDAGAAPARDERDSSTPVSILRVLPSDQPEALPDGDGQGEPENEDDAPFQYEERPGGIYLLPRAGQKGEGTRLTSFRAKIVSETERTDGVVTSRSFCIEASTGSRTARFLISIADYAALRWPMEQLGAGACIFPTRMAERHVGVAIQRLSGPAIPRETIFAHVGWTRIEGSWVYIHAGGGIGATGLITSLRVELSPALAPLNLPDPVDPDEVREALKASLSLLDLGPDELMFPLLAATVRGCIMPADFSVHVCGPTGTFKSEVSALCQQHYGAGFTARALPGSWTSTANALESLTHEAKDALVVLDDYAPTSGRNSVDQLNNKADRVFRGQGNRSGRGRCAPDGSLLPARAPRGLVVSTGEDVPVGESMLSRIAVLESQANTIDADKLTQAQKQAAEGRYAMALAAFIRDIAPRRDDLIQGWASRVNAAATDLAGSADHRRTPRMLGELWVGFVEYLDFAVRAGAIEIEKVRSFEVRAAVAFQRRLVAQGVQRMSSEPTSRFIELLSAALAGGEAHLASPTGSAPRDAASWGWRMDLWDGGGESTGPVAKGARIGYIDGEDLYLDLDLALKTAQKCASSPAESISVTATTLAKRLKEKGLLASTDDDHLRSQVTVEKRRRRLLHLRAETLRTSTEVVQSGQSPANPPTDGLPGAPVVLDNRGAAGQPVGHAQESGAPSPAPATPESGENDLVRVGDARAEDPLPAVTVDSCHACGGIDFWLGGAQQPICSHCHPPGPGTDNPSSVAS